MAAEEVRLQLQKVRWEREASGASGAGKRGRGRKAWRKPGAGRPGPEGEGGPAPERHNGLPADHLSVAWSVVEAVAVLEALVVVVVVVAEVLAALPHQNGGGGAR